MTISGLPRCAAVIFLASVVAGCAVRPVPDPRNPGMVRDGAVTLRVCIVNGDGAHLAVGDRVEFDTNRLGRLRIRHVPGPRSEATWNGGDDVRVKSAVLVELANSGDQRQQPAAGRRFVPVGRFPVRVGDVGHARFDFMLSRTTEPTRQHEYPECIADVGDDEIVIRGVDDDDRHGGRAILR